MEELIIGHLENTSNPKLSIFLGGAFLLIILAFLFFWGLPMMKNTGQNITQTYNPLQNNVNEVNADQTPIINN